MEVVLSRILPSQVSAREGISLCAHCDLGSKLNRGRSLGRSCHPVQLEKIAFTISHDGHCRNCQCRFLSDIYTNGAR
jgi:hypothetical protein